MVHYVSCAIQRLSLHINLFYHDVLNRPVTVAVAAARLNSSNTTALVERMAFWPFRGFLRKFAGVQGTGIYNGLKAGTIQYWNFTVQRLEEKITSPSIS